MFRVETKCETGSGVMTVMLTGELDHHAAGEAVREVAQAVDMRLPGALVLDMGGISFMDSSGIAVVMNAHRRMKEIGGRLSIAGLPPQARKVLRAAGLEALVALTGDNA